MLFQVGAINNGIWSNQVKNIWYKQNTDEYMSWEHDKKILKQKVQIDTNNKKSPTQNKIRLKEIVTENIAWLPTRFI